MTTTTLRITACIDGSAISTSVCDIASWASNKTNTPLTFLHVLEKNNLPTTENLSGTIGLRNYKQLLEELTRLDEQRNKLAVEHGKMLLSTITQKSIESGAISPTSEQRHDQLLDAVLACEEKTQLYVIGKLGKDHDINQLTIGSHIENIVRAIHTPILMATEKFTRPNNYMFAYDGSETANKSLQKIANNPLLSNLTGHIVMIGKDTPDNQQQLQSATEMLSKEGLTVQSHLQQGDINESLIHFQKQHHIEMIVMGAYGHSRIKEFFIGSNTTKMLAMSTVPILIVR